MKNVYVVALNEIPFLPYIHGLLRTCVERDAALIPQYRFGEPVFLSENPHKIVERLIDPSVIGFSCYVWNFRRHMKLARLLKDRHPNTLTVAGGPHVPDLVGDFFELHPYIDVLIHGEGEWTFRELLARYAPFDSPQRLDLADIAGVSFRTPNGVVTTPRRPQTGKTIDLPSPYTAGYLDSSIELCQRSALRFYAPWETNRGCPFSCAFCDWGSSTMSRVRLFGEEQIAADISYFGARGISNVFICDANFGMLSRDVEIAARLGDAHAKTGYPRQVRVNFAKNSNDRVFAISQIFERHSMLMGTTLSLQSMNADVLEAIDRSNIGIQQFTDLHERYSGVGIHTYTELILGLPRETRDSFCRGLCELLEAGNHQDVRVFDFMLLPNAPINTLASRSQYSLDTIVRPLFVDLRGTPRDEVETGEFVVSTSTMSRDEWRQCAVFAQLIQILHNGCFTRYLAIHLRRAYGLAYLSFYENLLAFANSSPRTVIGDVVHHLEQMYTRYLTNESVPQVNLVASQPKMIERLDRYGHRRGWTPDNWGWLCIAIEQDRFFDEIANFVRTLPLIATDELSEVLRYQSDIMLRESYDPKVGKTCSYRYDFPTYFTGSSSLEENRTVIRFRDTHLGVNRQYPLVRDDPKCFAKAAIGESYPFVRIRHYQHQLDAATVSEDRSARVSGGDNVLFHSSCGTEEAVRS
jgi:putative methyltransferase